MPYALAHGLRSNGPTPLDSAVLDALATSAAILDASGVVVTVNAAWRAQATANGYESPACGVGENYLKVYLKGAGDALDSNLERGFFQRNLLPGSLFGHRPVGAAHNNLEFAVDLLLLPEHLL